MMAHLEGNTIVLEQRMYSICFAKIPGTSSATWRNTAQTLIEQREKDCYRLP
jgi:hypothetical protein